MNVYDEPTQYGDTWTLPPEMKFAEATGAPFSIGMGGQIPALSSQNLYNDILDLSNINESKNWCDQLSSRNAKF